MSNININNNNQTKAKTIHKLTPSQLGTIEKLCIDKLKNQKLYHEALGYINALLEYGVSFEEVLQLLTDQNEEYKQKVEVKEEETEEEVKKEVVIVKKSKRWDQMNGISTTNTNMNNNEKQVLVAENTLSDSITQTNHSSTHSLNTVTLSPTTTILETKSDTKVKAETIISTTTERHSSTEKHSSSEKKKKWNTTIFPKELQSVVIDLSSDDEDYDDPYTTNKKPKLDHNTTTPTTYQTSQNTNTNTNNAFTHNQNNSKSNKYKNGSLQHSIKTRKEKLYKEMALLQQKLKILEKQKELDKMKEMSERDKSIEVDISVVSSGSSTVSVGSVGSGSSSVSSQECKESDVLDIVDEKEEKEETQKTKPSSTTTTELLPKSLPHPSSSLLEIPTPESTPPVESKEELKPSIVVVENEGTVLINGSTIEEIVKELEQAQTYEELEKLRPCIKSKVKVKGVSSTETTMPTETKHSEKINEVKKEVEKVEKKEVIKGEKATVTGHSKIDPHKPFCRWELQGGICQDSNCKMQHFGTYY